MRTQDPPHLHSSYSTCCHFEFGTVLQKSPVFVDVFPNFPAFLKQVATHVFGEFARLPSLCHFVAPQYAQTNLKQAQCIKSPEYLGCSSYPCCFFPSLASSLSSRLCKIIIFFTSQGANTHRIAPFASFKKSQRGVYYPQMLLKLQETSACLPLQ